MSEAKLLPSGGSEKPGGIKPRVSYADMKWLAAFARLKDLPQGTKLTAEGFEFTLYHVFDEPHPPSLWLKYREDYIVRKGDPLILKLNDMTSDSLREQQVKTYLGDSVYADVENGMIKLTTENGYPDDPRNVIYLEPEVYAALKRYVEPPKEQP